MQNSNYMIHATLRQFPNTMAQCALANFVRVAALAAAARRSGGIGLHQRLLSSTVNMDVLLSHTHLIVYALTYFLTSKSILRRQN
jgi:hypothetical protein